MTNHNLNVDHYENFEWFGTLFIMLLDPMKFVSEKIFVTIGAYYFELAMILLAVLLTLQKSFNIFEMYPEVH